MEQVVSITSKWQVHIPVAVRNELKLRKPGQATVKVKNNAIVITPKEEEIFAMKGIYKDRKPVRPIDIVKIRDYIDYSKW